MNFDKAELLLDKINRLFTSMKIDKSSVSSIERDLMRNYTQQFYEEFIGPDTSSSLSREPDSSSSPRNPGYQPPKPESSPSSSFLRETPTPRPPEKKAPAPEEKPEPPRPEPVKEEPPKQELPRQELPRQELPRQEPPPPPPEPEPSREKTRPAEDDEQYDNLFEQEQAKELADRLGESPIEDLTRAFSINDRIFNINELFGGDQDAFMDTLRHLNSLYSFEEAKNYLAREVAGKYNWTQKGKKSIAKSFIKTVRRRFNPR